MYSDRALLLQTVLRERGCMDETLHGTALTVPFVYRVIAEHTFYVIYTNSVVKALLHEKDGAFAVLARWQATRTATKHPLHPTSSTTSVSTQDVALVGVEVPPLLPCDALDMYITILGGGTVCELLLRLLIDGEAHRTVRTPGHLLVHPSHITVVTRQPARLARHAQRGVHCLRRHHGRSAVMQSDVVLLACPPALFREVAHDLLSAPASAAEVVRATVAETAAGRRASPRGASATSMLAVSSTGTSATSILQSNAVLLSCMAGVPARRVSTAFQRTPELTLVARITPQDGIADDTDGGDEMGSVSGPSGAPVTSYVASPSLALTALPTHGSLKAVALHYQDVVDDYKTSLMADMRCHISFLRPAVLQQQMLASPARHGAATAMPTNASATAAATTTRGGSRHVTWAAGEEVQTSSTNAHVVSSPTATAAAATWSAMSAPRRTNFTAGRQPATAPSLIAFLDLWRLLKAYVKATFDEALRKARSRARAAGGNSGGGGGNNSGLISVVLPSIPYGPAQVPGELEAGVLPALTLLPASKTLAVWKAWWRGGLSSNATPPPLPPPSSSSASRVVGGAAGQAARGEATPPAGVSATSLPLLSPRVTAVTGGWLSLVYASDEDLLADLELQYQHVLEGQLLRASG